MVDDSDYDWLNQWRWFVFIGKSNTFYAVRNRHVNGKLVSTRMHREILGLTDPKVLGEHADGNGLNNQRANLRPSTHSQNMMNRGSCVGAISEFKGVTWSNRRKMWASRIGANLKHKHLGYFDDEEDAARVYNQFAKKLHGEYARLNDVYPLFPETEWTPQVLFATNSSGFRGVSFRNNIKKWRAYIGCDGKQRHLGYFDNPSDAAKAYDMEAMKTYGDAARLNFSDTLLKLANQ